MFRSGIGLSDEELVELRELLDEPAKNMDKTRSENNSFGRLDYFGGLTNDIVNDMTFHIGQSHVSSAEAKRRTRVVDSE